MVKDPCDLYFLPVLGRTGGAILSLRYQKGDLRSKDLWCLQAQGAKPQDPIGTRFCDYFMAPHSRHTRMDEDAIRNNPDLIVLAESEEAGIFLILSKDNSQIFCMGHPEYDRLTLDKEYKRDLEKGMDIQMPVNYYPNDDVNERPFLQWRSHANCLYTNYLDYYVYQMTPYDLHWLPKDKR